MLGCGDVGLFNMEKFSIFAMCPFHEWSVVFLSLLYYIVAWIERERSTLQLHAASYMLVKSQGIEFFHLASTFSEAHALFWALTVIQHNNMLKIYAFHSIVPYINYICM